MEQLHQAALHAEESARTHTQAPGPSKESGVSEWAERRDKSGNEESGGKIESLRDRNESDVWRKKEQEDDGERGGDEEKTAILACC